MPKDRNARVCGCDLGALHLCREHDEMVRALESAGALDVVLARAGVGTCAREHQGFDLLMQKLLKEPVEGYKSLLPEPQFGQDVAMVAHLIDRLRNRIKQTSRRLESLARELTGV